MTKPKNLKKKLANPGERSKLPAKYLSKGQQQQRAMNVRLAQPVASIPGTQLASPVTERDLAHEAGAATNVRYGPQEGAIAEQLAQAVQQKSDTNTWYEDYKNRLQTYQQQVGAYQQGANDAMQGLQQGVTGLGQQDNAFVQSQQAGMPQGTASAPPASVGQNANAALAVRQGIAGNYGANQAQVGAANNTYASNLANVVGPQQQLTALSEKQGGINKVLTRKTTLKGQEGDYNQQYRATRRSDETKNLLAAGALGINATNAKTSAAKAVETARHNRATLRQQVKAEQDTHTVALANANTTAENLTETERHNRVMERLKKANPGKTVKPATGPGSISSAAETKVVDKVKQLKQLMGNSTWPGGPLKGKKMTAEQVRHHYQAQGLDDDIIRLAYSLYKNNGKLGPDGVRAAHALGIHVGGRWGQVGNTPKSTTNYGGGAGAGSGTT